MYFDDKKPFANTLKMLEDLSFNFKSLVTSQLIKDIC